MALPRKLKRMNFFIDGIGYVGEASSITLPKLTRKLDDWRGGGMDGTVKIDMGQEAMEMEWAFGGPMREVFLSYGIQEIGGVGLRYASAYQADDTSDVVAVEVIARGRHEELEMGESKPGEGGEFKGKSQLVYYQLIWNGEVLIECDVLAGILIVGGVDRTAQLRAAIGV